MDSYLRNHESGDAPAGVLLSLICAQTPHAQTYLSTPLHPVATGVATGRLQLAIVDEEEDEFDFVEDEFEDDYDEDDLDGFDEIEGVDDIEDDDFEVFDAEEDY